MIVSNGADLLERVDLIEYATDKKSYVSDGCDGWLVSCLYCSCERTLTDSEVNTVHTQIIKALQEKLGATIR